MEDFKNEFKFPKKSKSMSILDETIKDSNDDFLPAEIAQLFSEKFDSPMNSMKLKTSSPFILNQNKSNIKDLAPPLLNMNLNMNLNTNLKEKAKVNDGNTKENLDLKDTFLDKDLDSFFGNIELPSFNDSDLNISCKINDKPKFNKSFSEPTIEKKYSLLDDDLFDTKNMDDLENQLVEIENIATQTLNLHDKNTIVLCDQTNSSIQNQSGINKKRLNAIQRLQCRTENAILNDNQHFYPELNSTFKK